MNNFKIKLKIVFMMLLIPIASVFEVTNESYTKKVSRHYKDWLKLFKSL
ncbi:hypothetical protein K092500153_05970 [Clostridium tetani]